MNFVGFEIDSFGNFIVTGMGDDYINALNQLNSIILLEISDNLDDDEIEKEFNDALKTSTYFIQYMMKSKYILNFSERTFTLLDNYDSIDTFTPLNNLSTYGEFFENKTKQFFNIFFTDLINNIAEVNKKRIEEVKDRTLKLNDNDIKNQMNYSFKTIYDRWIPSPNLIGRTVNSMNGYPFTGKPLFDSFKFVDRAFNNIGDKVQLNIDSLIDMENDFDLSVFQIMSRILSENNFEFFPVENFMVFDNNCKWDDAFGTFTSINDQTTQPYFVSMHIGGTSSS